MDEFAFMLDPSDMSDAMPELDEDPDWKPQVLYEMLNEHVVGQEQAKRASTMLVYNTWQHRPSNLLIVGQSGSGKTEIWRQFVEYAPIGIHMLDAAQVTPPGYRGASLADLLCTIRQYVSGKPSVVILDEADKLMLADAYGVSNTSQMLKLLDHDVVTMKTESASSMPFNFDATQTSFVLVGAFTELLAQKKAQIGFGATPSTPTTDTVTEDDLLRIGVSPEILGRIGRIVTMEPPTADIYIRIAQMELEKLSQTLQRPVRLSDDTLQRLVTEALQRQTGARYVKNYVNALLDDMLFDCPDAESYDLA